MSRASSQDAALATTCAAKGNFLRSPIPAGCEVWAVCVGAERVGDLGELAGAVRKDCGDYQNVSLVVSQCDLA